MQIKKGSTLVCSEHFAPEYIKKTLIGISKLTKNAVRSIFEWTRRTPNRPANRLQTNWSPRKRLRFEDSDNDEIDSNQEPSSLEEASDSVQDDIQNINNKLPSFDEQIMEANRKIEELESKLKELRLERFGLERFSSNPEQLQFYT